MIKFIKSLPAWGTSEFENLLKQEIAEGCSQLPLQQALLVGSHVLDKPITATVQSVVEVGELIRVKVGIFFQSIIAGCNCSDDPTPVNEINEYCELQFDINRVTAISAVTLL